MRLSVSESISKSYSQSANKYVSQSVSFCFSELVSHSALLTDGKERNNVTFICYKEVEFSTQLRISLQ